MHPLIRIATFLLFCFLSLLPVRLEAQDPYYIHYNVNNGLPSNEIYGIVFDNNKVLWATTDRGVVSFDGYQFRQFTVSEGLKENCNLRIFHDRQNDRIYLSSLNNYLCYIQESSVHEHPLSQTVHQLGGLFQYVQQIGFHPDGSMDLCFNRPGLFHLTPGLPPDTLGDHIGKMPSSCLTIFYNPAGNSTWDMTRYPEDKKYGQSSVYQDGSEF